MTKEGLARRPIAARETGWARKIAGILARAGVRPNVISVFSVVCAAIAGVCLFLSDRTEGGFKIAFLIGAAVSIQARLLCNLFDGMVAVEGGLRSKSGEIYNELPDRFADALILVGAGYACETVRMVAPGLILGWLAAVLALITAYVRSLGVAAGASQQFCGPMAKQQRMFLVTVGALWAVLEVLLAWKERALSVALILIILGCVVTIPRRTIRIVRELETRS